MAAAAAIPGTAARPARRRRTWAVVPVALAATLWLSLAPGDPALYPGGTEARAVWVIDHGWHSGIALRASDLRAAAVAIGRENPDAAHRLRSLAAEWPDAPWLEIGWGDRAVYLETPTLEDLDLGDAAAAILWPTPSVLQVVPLWAPPDHAFARAGRVRLPLTDDGITRLAARLAETLGPGPRTRRPRIAPSLYGQGAFFEAAFGYHGLRTCNHWVSGVLRAAGVPSSWIASATSTGLLAELRLRAL